MTCNFNPLHRYLFKYTPHGLSFFCDSGWWVGVGLYLFIYLFELAMDRVKFEFYVQNSPSLDQNLTQPLCVCIYNNNKIGNIM